MKKILFLMLMTLGVFTLLSARASAMCVYNKLSGNPPKITVIFVCGAFCNNFWVINPGDNACRSKTGGEVNVCIGDDPDCDVKGDPPACTVNVLDHGWVDVVGDCDGTDCNLGDPSFACNAFR